MVVDLGVAHDADGKGGGLAFVEHEGADDTAFVLFQKDISGKLQTQITGDKSRAVFVEFDPVGSRA